MHARARSPPAREIGRRGEKELEKKKKKKTDRRYDSLELTRAVKLGASGDVVHAAVDGDQYSAVRTLAIVLGQFLDREVASQLGQLLHLLHRLLVLRAALDDLVDENGDHAHQGEVHRTLDDLGDESRQELLRLLRLLSGRGGRRAVLLGHLDERPEDLSQREEREGREETAERKTRGYVNGRSRADRVTVCVRLLVVYAFYRVRCRRQPGISMTSL